VVAPACATITDIRPHLTLEGLYLLYAMNRKPGRRGKRRPIPPAIRGAEKG